MLERRILTCDDISMLIVVMRFPNRILYKGWSILFVAFITREHNHDDIFAI